MTVLRRLCLHSHRRQILLPSQSVTNAEDGEFTRHKDFRDNLLVFAAFKVCAGMNGVFAGPARGSEQRVQTICVSAFGNLVWPTSAVYFGPP